MTHNQETPYGFEFGGAEIRRITRHDNDAVTLGLCTKKAENCWQIYVTKTGKVRIWNPAGIEMVPKE